jgi:hypothetical protein
MEAINCSSNGLEYVKGAQVYRDHATVFEKLKREYPPVTARDFMIVQEAAFISLELGVRSAALDRMLQRLIDRNVRKELWSPAERAEFDQRMRWLASDRNSVMLAYRRMKYLAGPQKRRLKKFMRQNGERNGKNAI